MPKKTGSGKRRFQRYIRGSLEEIQTFGSLGSRAVQSTNMDSTVNERTFVSSIVATWSVSSLTPGVNMGPIICGVAHGDYSDAEILEFMTQTGSWNETDLIAQEISRRKIRRVGAFEQPEDAEDAQVLNDGKAIKTKLGWILSQGQTLKTFVFNSGTANVATTTPSLVVNGHANLWPK